ncbi:MAG: alpha-L-glutamate ligase [Cellulomonas sp.]|jgi:glutathione synthase/RimK-type ligase-like ATP-grasp enzyme|nr:alpha-L-glutamate ligase [Cellulomonas sp.]
MNRPVIIVHENPEWIPPLARALDTVGLPFEEWLLTGGAFDPTATPPDAVYWSRLSASAHTRGHGTAKDHARALLAWLEAHGRRVVNGSAALELEVSKVRQYVTLAAAGLRVPRTVAVVGTDDLVAQAARLPTPFVTKHNQGGKGLGVRRFDDLADFAAVVARGGLEPAVDGITLLQEYVSPAEPFITRLEFVGGRFHYAVRVDISAGSFELCPAEACQVPAASDLVLAGSFPVSTVPVSTVQLGVAAPVCDTGAADTFTLRPQITAEHPLVRQLEAYLAAQQVAIAGVEIIETPAGDLVVYDVNVNTNYHPGVEAEAPSAALAVARYLAALSTA